MDHESSPDNVESLMIIASSWSDDIQHWISMSFSWNGSFAFYFTLGKGKHITLNQTIQVRQLSDIDVALYGEHNAKLMFVVIVSVTGLHEYPT